MYWISLEVLKPENFMKNENNTSSLFFPLKLYTACTWTIAGVSEIIFRRLCTDASGKGTLVLGVVSLRRTQLVYSTFDFKHTQTLSFKIKNFRWMWSKIYFLIWQFAEADWWEPPKPQKLFVVLLFQITPSVGEYPTLFVLRNLQG